jgi:hypothetical protein
MFALPPLLRARLRKQEGVLREIGVAGVIERVGEGPGQADVLVELADGQQPAGAGELTR